MSEVHWTELIGEAFCGSASRSAVTGYQLHGLSRRPQRVPVHVWRSPAQPSDRAMLAHCSGPTLDIGCGPGRMSAHLAATGVQVLGIDVVPEAVEQTRARGVPAMCRDIFDPVPGEGRWACALLADGNVGIGGDPARLLRRVHTLLAASGRVIVDLAPPGSGTRTAMVRLERDGRSSSPFPWAIVEPDSIAELAGAAGFDGLELHQLDGRWFAVLHGAAA